jgi:hypothetical protein
MVRRKFYASLLMLIVASMTLVSGTYAWFLVGGFGSLFDIGFDVIEAGAGIELKGSASSSTWKSHLERDDFAEGSFLDADTGAYSPISSSDASNDSFIKLSLEDNNYISSSNVAAGVDYNNFTMYARSTTEAPVNIGMKIAISSDENEAACDAARVSVTFGGSTKIYALKGQAATNAVTSTFADGAVVDTIEDRIITSGDSGYSAANLVSQSFTELDPTGVIDSSGEPILLENIVANSNATGSQIDVKIWLEGNDADCVDLPSNSIAGQSLTVKITFTTL